MQFELNQPIYTAGRLQNAYGIQASSLDASKLQLERARQELQYQVVETFYAALMNEQGVRVADEQIALATQQLGSPRRASTPAASARLDVLQAEVELANSQGAPHPGQGAPSILAYQALRTVLSLPQSQAARCCEGSLDERPEQLTRDALTGRDSRAARSPRVCRAAGHGEHSVALANAEVKPSLALTGNLQYQDDGIDSLLKTNNQSYTLGSRCACRCSRRRPPRPSAPSPSAGQADGARPQRRDRCRASRGRVGLDGVRGGR